MFELLEQVELVVLAALMELVASVELAKMVDF